MKKNILILFAFVMSLNASAQFDLEERLREKINNRASQKVDEGIDKGLDKTEEGVKNSVKKKDKNKESKAESSGANSNSSDNGSNSSEGEKSSGNAEGKSSTGVASMKSYSKFDFVPGDKVIFFDDYSTDNIGDFPSKWNTNGSGEVVNNSMYPGKWLKMRNASTYLPEIISNKFPENYTVEYDMIVSGEDRNGTFSIELTSLENKNEVPDASDPTNNTGLFLNMEMSADGAIRYLTKATINTDGNPTSAGGNTDINNFALQGKADEKFHVSITVNKQRFRYYVNENKVLDLPKLLPSGKYNIVLFRMWGWTEDHPFDALISNFRYAEGTTDVRSKLMTEGKLVTHGILFDVNSDKIKPESYGTIKEISEVLKENSAVKVKIIGHTDSDGDDKSNLELSKRRAAAVKNTLSKEFGIDSGRMETDGKGESEAAASNSTPEGKATNRRVEFIKLN